MCVLLKKRSIYVVSSSVIFDYVYCFFFLDKSKRSLINRWIYVSCKERLEMHTVEIISSFIFTPDFVHLILFHILPNVISLFLGQCLFDAPR